jgi:hypothetical protein
MARSGQRKCLNCGEIFDPDCRNMGRQHHCSKPECRRASKAAAQAAWLAKPQNSDYFSGPTQVARVRAWRAAHPGYGRGRRQASPALQDGLPVQMIDLIEETPDRGELPEMPALQDALPPLEPMLTGLIAHVFGFALQDDIDQIKVRLVQIGTDITHRSHRHEDRQTSAAPRARAQHPRTI